MKRWRVAPTKVHYIVAREERLCRTKEYKYILRMGESHELYDLRRDPGETVNVIRDPAYAPVVSELKDRTLAWYAETCDVVPHAMDARW